MSPSLLAAGLAAGSVNAVAGGGSLITFPALLSTGLGQVAANVTNSVAVSPGYLASVYGSRSDLADLADSRGRRTLLALLPTAVAGTAAGCALLLATPSAAFEVIVPFLVLAAAIVLAFQARLRELVGHPRRDVAAAPRDRVTCHGRGSVRSTAGTSALPSASCWWPGWVWYSMKTWPGSTR